MLTKRKTVMFSVASIVAAALVGQPAVAEAGTAGVGSGAAAHYIDNPPQCVGGAAYGWFCAYSGQNFTGRSVGSYDCVDLYIPFLTTGSWHNNQTRGTRPVLHWVDSSRAPWTMPAAPALQLTGVDWRPVHDIVVC